MLTPQRKNDLIDLQDLSDGIVGCWISIYNNLGSESLKLSF